MFVRLMAALFSVVATVLMGILVTAALASGLETSRWIILAAATGFVLAIPVSWAVARAIVGKQSA